MRMTSQRKQILKLLKLAKRPLSAEMIYEQLPQDTLNLSTVYRTLDLFFKEKMVAKSFMQQTTYYYLNEEKHHHYMICLGCQKMIEIACHLDEMEKDLADKHHFDIKYHDMTVYGYCQACQNK